MENNTKKTIVLGDNRKYIIIRQLVYKDDTYYFVSRINDEETEILNDFNYIKEVKKDGKSFCEFVTDPEVLKVLLDYTNLDED